MIKPAELILTCCQHPSVTTSASTSLSIWAARRLLEMTCVFVFAFVFVFVFVSVVAFVFASVFAYKHT